MLRGAQEDLTEKGHLVAALEQERQQILQELEGYRARVGKEAGQDESKPKPASRCLPPRLA